MNTLYAFGVGTFTFILSCGVLITIGTILYIVDAFLGPTGMYTGTAVRPDIDFGTIHCIGALGIMFSFWFALGVALFVSQPDPPIKRE